MPVNVYRGAAVESWHRVSAVVTDVKGNIHSRVGDADLVTYARSTVKPFQALPLVATGAADALGLTDQELALTCGSHNGEAAHVETAASILRKAGLDETALRCGAQRPYHRPTARSLAGEPTSLHNNCSGKHAGMLAACVHNGWDLDTYLDPDHPLQRMVLDAVSTHSGVPVEDMTVAVDGCSAPTFTLPLPRLARLYAHLARPDAAGDHEKVLTRLADVMTRHPWFVAGSDRLDTILMDAAEGRLVSKVGGEAVHVVADRHSGLALALKVEDGTARARDPAAVEACRQLGWLDERSFEVLGDLWRPTLTNWAGKVVGRIEPAFTLERPGIPQ